MKQFALFIFMSCCLVSCKCQKETSTEAGPVDNPSLLVPTQAVVRLTPEQISKQIKQALEIEIGWTDEDGRFHDLIIEQYGVPLGGIDFISASKRDPVPKVQTLLLVRRIAYDVASSVVWREARPDATGSILFQNCKLTEDHPILPKQRAEAGANQDELQAMEDRWLAQLDDFYWRLYGRPPTETEKYLVRDAAIEIMQRERWPPTVWVLVLYALMSSQEFWTI